MLLATALVAIGYRVETRRDEQEERIVAAQLVPAISSDGLYLSVVVAGLLGLGVMQLLRTLGVKLSWTS